MSLQPFSFVENNLMWCHSHHNPISVDSLQRYIHALMAQVMQNISAMLPKHFAVVFEGWWAGDTPCVSIFATYPSEQTSWYDSVVLPLSQMGEEDSQTTKEDFQFVRSVLGVFKKSWKNVAAFVNNHFSTIKAFGRPLGLCLSVALVTNTAWP